MSTKITFTSGRNVFVKESARHLNDLLLGTDSNSRIVCDLHDNWDKLVMVNLDHIEAFREE